MDFKAIAMGLTFALFWSSAFTSARFIVMDAPPFPALALRFLISGLMAVGIARLSGQTWRLPRSQWWPIILFGVCQNALYLGLNFLAMKWVEASLASIIASTMPMIVALLGWLFFGQKMRPLGLAGLVLGVVGVSIIMGERFSGDLSLPGVAMCVVGALALAVATLTVRGASAGGNLLMIVGLQMFVGSALLALVALVIGDFHVVWTGRLAIAFAYTTLFPGLIATWLWFRLVGRIGAVKAATFHFLNPFFGVLVAALFLHESLGLSDMVGVAIICAGILAVQLSRQRG